VLAPVLCGWAPTVFLDAAPGGIRGHGEGLRRARLGRRCAALVPPPLGHAPGDPHYDDDEAALQPPLEFLES